MKLWLSKNSEVSVRDQLVAQVIAGVASGDLKPGERLPSTREIARRFGVHANTVSAAYRKLSENAVVELRKGSGVFIAEKHDGKGLDRLIAGFLEQASAEGYSRTDIRDAIRTALDDSFPKGFLLVESDKPLRNILINEIGNATGETVIGIAFEEFESSPIPAGYRLVAMYDEEPKLRAILPPGVSCIFLKANSVSNAMTGQGRPDNLELIAVISGWERFVSLARLFLSAAKIDPDRMITRLTSESDWRRGIDQATLVICDALTATMFPNDGRVRIFELIARASLEELVLKVSHN